MLQKNWQKIFNCELCKQVALKNAVCFPKIAKWQNPHGPAQTKGLNT